MTRTNTALLILLGAVFVWSAIRPHDYFTWILETFPAIIGFVILAATYRRFPLTPLAYSLLMIHAAILMLGGHYTYAEVPLGYWMRDLLHGARNNYDRIGHFAQGFVPAILAREILRKKVGLRPGGWLFFLVICVCLALSACYELFEWAMAVATGSKADAFLGTQGDPWDTQWDMLWALIGALTAQLTLSPLHERQLSFLSASSVKS